MMGNSFYASKSGHWITIKLCQLLYIKRIAKNLYFGKSVSFKHRNQICFV